MFRTSKKSCQICSSAKLENVPSPTISTLWELMMFQVSFRRLFRNELSTKNAGSSEKLKTNKGPEFEVP